jgi:hypothetical protein
VLLRLEADLVQKSLAHNAKTNILLKERLPGTFAAPDAVTKAAWGARMVSSRTKLDRRQATRAFSLSPRPTQLGQVSPGAEVLKQSPCKKSGS